MQSFRIITFNANGIRSAGNKGFFNWAAEQNADVICIQELKAQEGDMHAALTLPGYHHYFHCAQKKGYSGVAIFTRHQPSEVHVGLGFPLADDEGRHVMVKLGQLWVASAYLPSGTSGPERQACKFNFLSQYHNLLCDWQINKGHLIICGD